jgi:hypothetical protein
MKILLQFLFFFIFSISTFSQNHQENFFYFDYHSSYTLTNSKKTIVKNVFFNSKDSSYYMMLSEREGENYANIYSFKNNKEYSFKLNESNNYTFNFKYLGFYKNFFNKKLKPIYEFTKLKDNELRLDIFKNKRKKKIIETHFIKTISSEEPLFAAYKYAIFNPMVSEFFIVNTDSIKITEVEIYCNDVWGSKIKLDKIQKVNFKLKIPD